jgi:hypothetical protein
MALNGRDVLEHLVMERSAYKLAHLDRMQIEAAARRALIAADGRYFSWTTRDQERFRATMSDDVRRKVRCVLLESLLDIQCTTAKVDESWNDVPCSQINLLNWAMLLTTGVGDDCIYLNECMAEGKSLLDFPTLYDYDYADYLFQKEARKQDFPEYGGVDYYAYQHPSWVRLLINEQFYYSTFTSLATYALDEIVSVGNETIRQLIPHEHIDGKNHGKREKGGFLWDVRIDAAGQEAQLDELKSRFYDYQQERWLALSETNARQPPAVYARDEDWDDDPHRSFIFVNKETLKRIRWRYFLADCESLLAELSAVESLLTEEVDRANTWLANNHQDIGENFDPGVVKLRKKRKIVVSPSALDDLMH